MPEVLACIDGSTTAPAVCDYAVWASQRLQTSLTLLHVLDKTQYPQRSDLSGIIGLGTREHLLEELASVDQQHSKRALEQSQQMLEAAQQRAIQAGIESPLTRQRHGSLVESLVALEESIRLLVIGRHSTTNDNIAEHVGSQLEPVIRTLQCPALVTCGDFLAPQNYLFAYDGSFTARKALQRVADSPLLQGLHCHLLMVGSDRAACQALLEEAAEVIRPSASEVSIAWREADVEPSIRTYQLQQKIDLLVMGAYGHSRIRQFLLGSTTSQLIASSLCPLLILR
ncbi:MULTISPECIES: universal stress protein [Pseudomonas]|uniref:Nucleotide-binding universal stress protein, UspA family n=1 Tax=Pseudomonas segetis TaxID=298908 RepID=A0A239DBR0_9PSED|nr:MULTISPECIES: universal stress protein [Pseudomonas]SNS29836.1 Nucleotide-binding universal stress protein, UspA family [Pseudomonas segetis]